MLPDLDERQVATWVQLRNEIVHRGRLATEGEAREIVAGMEELLRQLGTSSATALGERMGSAERCH